MTKAEIQAVRLLADKRERDARGLFVAEGAKLVGELRASPMRIRHLYAVAANPQFPEAEIVPAKDMERMSMLKTASDVLAVVGSRRCGSIPRLLPTRSRSYSTACRTPATSAR